MAIRVQRRGQLMLVALLIGAIAALPLLLHCLPGDTHQGNPVAHHQGNLATASQSVAGAAVALAAGVIADHPHAGSAVHGALCQSVDGLTAALRADNPLRLLAAFAAAIVAAIVAAPLVSRIGRGPPVRAAAAFSRSGRVLLTDLCIIRR
ncbi:MULTISPECIES: hypothetical protein [Mycobacteriaceae]|uniref:hypothetical protein n=1 Tax=Mycobacteriaceae TaxID=1762 RepID=UPI001E28422B|nr:MULTISPECIES: hypothetical protein [Mycobacteriaceae]MDM2175066.1 hypothetical protein [Mycobacteroides abscessus]MDM2179765.1 hypothetical protein [Mycobacteroides abscessus]MDM2207804.1 hypothetical protein [Mycobacteroides abscessus]MDM2211450.1 hypothetical protein [Mycobacteroides abscessus]MDM2217736.1 hypothetical protein [Mycobacteroides abscessus]